MVHISGEVTIDAPVEEVFDLVADERTEPKYNPRIASAEKLSDGPVGVGTRFAAQPKGMSVKGQMSLEILGYDRPRRLHSVVRSAYMNVDGILSFTQVDGRTARQAIRKRQHITHSRRQTVTQGSSAGQRMSPDHVGLSGGCGECVPNS